MSHLVTRRGSLHLALLVLACSASAGCAYQYAGENAPDKHYSEKERTEDPDVVKVKGEDNTIRTSDRQKAKNPESPCGVVSFEIHRYEPTSRVTRTIDCNSGESMKVERTPLGQTRLQTLRQKGYPENTWYLLVDPDGLRSNYMNNVELMKLKREFDVKFEGKDRGNNLMIYSLDMNID